MKKTFFFLALALISLNLFAQQKSLKNFDELMTALNGGEQVRVIIHYGKCTLISDNEIEDKSPDAIGGMTIDTYEYFAPKAVRGNENAFVVFSENKLIMNPKGKGFVYNYGKFRIESTGKVKVTVMYIDPNTQEEMMSENFFTTFGESKTEQAIFFYKQ
ncbi:MAG TPA: VirK family protein [Tenuifilaceae bacterium]|nr:VirK family protein [Tenuifilaceae bacterium]